MTIKKLLFLALVSAGFAFPSCQKDPSTSDLHRDYLVYTDYDSKADFAGFDTYYVPDSILLIGQSDKQEYWNDANARQIVGTVVSRMNGDGFVRTYDKETADLGIQISYVSRVTYYVGYDYPYWWSYYPYYWTPGYWGDWLGWYYPYRVYYGYTAGSMLIEMVNLEAADDGTRKLPIVWTSFIGGLLTASEQINQERTVAAVNQAFDQSPYLRN